MPMTPLCSRATAPLAVFAFLFVGIVVAQDKPDRPPWAQKSKSASKSNPAPASSSTGDSQDPGAQRGRIRVTVNLVNVLVSVLDEHNRPAPDLPLESFQLFEEGVQQKIDKLESETLQPLDLAIIIDASLSAHKEITFEQEAAAHFIRQVLRPGDRLSVFCFDENVTQVAPFSDNVADLQAAVRRIPAGEHALETMTDTTGGAMFYPDSTQELGAIFDRIDRELRTQYRLAYYPNPRGPANTYRSIVVTVNPSNYKVRHRKSYLTGPQ